MIEWSSRAVRHIPDEELHAYLDQALSRSQCVEIESHLADCPGCSALRDDTAALRDRTTALLARLGPGPIVPPSFSTLRDRYEAERRWRRQWTVRAGWAASLILAAGLGWKMNQRVQAEVARLQADAPIAVAPVAIRLLPSDSRSVAVPDVPTSKPQPTRARQAVALREPTSSRLPVAAFQVADESAEVMVASYAPGAEGTDQASREVFSVESQPAVSGGNLQGFWRNVGVDGLEPSTPGQLPRVPGLPVIQVQVQPGEAGGEVTAVDQQLEDGQLIRTIEGPAAKVSSLIANQEAEDASGHQPDAAKSNQPDKMTLTLRQGDRMLAVTGPSKVLGSLMISRGGVRRRY
jgi:putative zinc finger protein